MSGWTLQREGLCRSDPPPSKTYTTFYDQQYKTIRHHHIQTSDLSLFLSQICMKKLHKKTLLAGTRRRTMILCMEREGEGTDQWRHLTTLVTWLHRTAVSGWRVLLIFSFRLIRLHSYHRLWAKLHWVGVRTHFPNEQKWMKLLN